MKSNEVLEKLDEVVPNPVCELIYNKDYELLIATVLAAQSTDKRVNEVTKVLFSKYDIFSLAKENIKNIEDIIYPVGTYKRKAEYISVIAKRLVNDYDGKVPNDRKYLESLPGVGRKTTNVVLSVGFDEPAFAVDTHVERISKRLGFAKKDDTVNDVERKVCRSIPRDRWNKAHHQFIFFGRYFCKAQNPNCKECHLYDMCKDKIKEVRK